MIAQVAVLASLVALAHAGAIGLGLGGIGLEGGLGRGLGLGGIGLEGGLGRGLGLGIGSIGGLGLGGGIAVGTRAVDLYAPPKYEYKYAVEDAHTGDLKEQVESRIGDLTKSEYALAEKDRATRVSRIIAGGKTIGLGI